MNVKLGHAQLNIVWQFDDAARRLLLSFLQVCILSIHWIWSGNQPRRFSWFIKDSEAIYADFYPPFIPLKGSLRQTPSIALFEF